MQADLQFGSFLTQKRVRVGSIDERWSAVDSRTGSARTLEFLLPHLADDETIRKAYLDLGNTLKTLDHPNVERALEAGHANQRDYIAYEAMDGATLTQVIREATKPGGPFPIGVAVYIIREAARGLQHAHDKGLVHRTLGFNEVLISSKGAVRVSDFTQMIPLMHTLSSEQLPQKKAGLTAPEVAQGQGATAATDQYHAAFLLYSLLAGRKPFESGSAAAFFEKAKEGALPPIETFREDTPKELSAALSRALAKSPANRFSSMKHFDDALSSATTLDEPAAKAQLEEWVKLVG